LQVQDWFASEEAAGCLLVVFGERREIVHAGSGSDSGERHVWRSRGVVVVGWDGRSSMAARSRINISSLLRGAPLGLGLR
jgi:hypothetical protein